ncbi:hypothetical protein [Paenibacillus puerhi]|nr:hypothetical protein [Paenibacillus puerhi]
MESLEAFQQAAPSTEDLVPRTGRAEPLERNVSLEEDKGERES